MIKTKNINLHFSHHAWDFDYLTPGFQISNQGPYSSFFSANFAQGKTLFSAIPRALAHSAETVEYIDCIFAKR